MYIAKDKLGQRVYVTTVVDYFGDLANEPGWYCQVYADENFGFEVDFFCIHPENCNCRDDVAVQKYIYDYVASEAYDLTGYYEWRQQWYVPEASDEYFAQVEEDKRNDIDDLV